MAARTPWTKPLFITKFPGDDVHISIRRSLGAMDLGSAALKKFCEAADSLKLKYEIPFNFTDCYCHFAIPSKKIAVFMRQSVDTTQFMRIKKQWEESRDGKEFSLLFTTTRQVDQMSVEELSKNLASQIGGKR